MSIILIIFCIWGASALIRAIRQAAMQRQIERINEQNRQAAIRAAQLREEFRRAQEQQKEEVQRRILLEREQARLAKEEERLAKEQKKQAAQIAKHEERIMSLETARDKALLTIKSQNERLSDLYAQLDYVLLLQAGTVPGGKEHAKYQNKVVSLNNQVRTAEERRFKAEKDKEMAERKLEVA